MSWRGELGRGGTCGRSGRLRWVSTGIKAYTIHILTEEQVAVLEAFPLKSVVLRDIGIGRYGDVVLHSHHDALFCTADVGVWPGQEVERSYLPCGSLLGSGPD